ncbi:ARM repeat-containing protein [Dendrothele bispora CBS 962.96]|uniref:ARM repeat-containing protein n=1 Tax=Dendrothele bispora (strain CBS 962.96) TaxID=1314807 RepID=A0A4S8M126_DENBC|nr:ARM repeat-containing protein [Dendrothele bispora CBS 962.96]
MSQAGRSDSRIDSYMAKIYNFARESELNIHRLITAGVVNLLNSLLRRRAASNRDLEVVLITLGVLSHDSISADLICRTQTAKTLIQLCSPRYSDEIVTLSLWCLNRICRNTEAASGLLKLDIVPAIKQLATEGMLPTMAVYCLGTLIQSDAHANMMESLDVIPYITRYLRRNSQNNAGSEDKCAGLYAIARLSRSIKLAKALARAGCIPLLTFNLRDSRDPDVLNWSARAIGCLMRPNSVDMARSLLDAGAAEGLARLPTVLAPGCLEPLESFGFAIQRFSCAEWGKATRVALLDAGVIDSLLAALRTAAIEPCNEVQAALAQGISLLGDVGGSVIRREIVNAGGINILKDVGSRGSSDVSRACEMAITSITGNVLTRNAGKCWFGDIMDVY